MLVEEMIAHDAARRTSITDPAVLPVDQQERRHPPAGSGVHIVVTGHEARRRGFRSRTRRPQFVQHGVDAGVRLKLLPQKTRVCLEIKA